MTAEPVSSYISVRGLLGIILGLGIGHLLQGVARMVENRKQKPYWVHLLWCLFLFLYLLHFWWWEMHLDLVTAWTFPVYFLIAMYATVAYMACVILMPGELREYENYRLYFFSRKAWFFSLIIALLLLDLLDTRLKGAAYWHSMGTRYLLREVGYLLLSVLGIVVANRRLQATLAILAVLGEIAYILQYFRTVG